MTISISSPPKYEIGDLLVNEEHDFYFIIETRRWDNEYKLWWYKQKNKAHYIHEIDIDHIVCKIYKEVKAF